MIGLAFCSVPVSFRIFNVASQNYRIIELPHTHRGLALVFLVWCLWSSFQSDTLAYSIIYQSDNVGRLYMLYDCFCIFGQRAGYISVTYLYCELKTRITIITNFLSGHNCFVPLIVLKHAMPPSVVQAPNPNFTSSIFSIATKLKHILHARTPSS
jgi:hypothetical protein